MVFTVLTSTSFFLMIYGRFQSTFFWKTQPETEHLSPGKNPNHHKKKE